ncbi:hypothetical protein, conserved [Plasmodium gonderi]|uniref:RING-type domain-containing protein n=1 Tax=Plasmodium gonderi TaxID=77519 RepID=A0A1Y1JJC6_PLAGO|nr:hypothetical protein, conserved [Plasmodium gonderi]GAW80553.1 hypothetical protein, conserved [Plasmodium gonderi]
MSVLSLFHIGSPFLRTNCTEKKEIYENFICSVCLDICHNPVVTLCNHICCYKCLYYSLLHKRKCPICKQAIKNNELKRITGKRKSEYEEIRIRCNLCNDELKIKNHKRHLKYCKYRRCNNYVLGCEYYDKKNKIKFHEESCEHRLIRCSSCSNLFYYKNRIFMLTLKEKYQLNIRSTYTYYSFYYNLLMNINYKFFNYKYITKKNVSCDNNLSKKLSILRTLQRTLDRLVYKAISTRRFSEINQRDTTVNPSLTTTTQSNRTFNPNQNNLHNHTGSNNKNVSKRGHANVSSYLNIQRNDANYQDHLNFNTSTENATLRSLETNIPLHPLITGRLNNTNIGVIGNERSLGGFGERKYLKEELHKLEKMSQAGLAGLAGQMGQKSRSDRVKGIPSKNELAKRRNRSHEEEFLNILPLRKTFNFKDKTSKDILVIIKELFQFENIDMSSICIDNKEFFLCNKNCFRNTIKNLKSELQQLLVLLYFCCCVGMPAMFTLGCMSYITTKGVFKFSFLLVNTFISLSQRFILKFFYS